VAVQTLAEAAIEARVDFSRAGADVGPGARRAGQQAADEVTKGFDGKVRNSRGQFQRTGQTLGEGLGEGTHRGFLARIMPGMRGAGRSASDSFSRGFGDGNGAFSTAAAMLVARAAVIGATFAAAAPGVAQLTAALAPAAGAMIALPAVIGGVVAAQGVLRLATMGVGDAISEGFTGNAKQAEAALAKLSPAARTFAQQVIGMQGPLRALQQSTADRFFGAINDQVRPLSDRYLPLLGQLLPRIAQEFGRMGASAAVAARQGPAYQGIRDVLARVADGAAIVRGEVGGVVLALGRVLSIGAPAITGLAQGFADAAGRVTGFINSARGTAQLTAWLDGAKRTLADLGGIFQNVGGIIAAVYRAANTGGNTLLTNLRELTGQVRDFVTSAQGTQAIATAFGTLSSLGQSLRTSLGAVLPAIAQSVQTAAPAVAALANSASRLVVALAPLLPAVTQVTAQMALALVPALNAVAGWLQRNQGLVQGLAPVIVGLVVAQRAHTAALAVSAAAHRAWAIATGAAKVAQAAWTAVSWLASAPIHAQTAAMTAWNSVAVLRVRVWAIDAAAAIRSTAATVAHRVALVASTVAMRAQAVATAAWAAITTGATAAMGAARTGVLLLNAAMRANPIGAVITVITLLVGALVILYQRNETVRRIVDAVWAGIKTAIGAVASWFTGTILPSLRRALDQLATAFRWIKDRIAESIAGWRLVIGAVVNWVNTYVVTNFRRGLQLITAGFQLARNVISQSIAGWRLIISTGWDFIRGRFEALRQFITVTLPQGFRNGVTAITNAWNRVREAARVPVAFVVNSVINPLLRGWNALAGVFSAPKVNEIRGFQSGGRIAGMPSRVDNQLGTLTDRRGRPIGNVEVATGEYVVNADATARWLPVLDWINRFRGRPPRGLTELTDPAPYRHGGKVRDGIPGYQFGGLIDWAKNAVSKVVDVISDPSGALRDITNAAINRIPGGGFIRTAMVGAGRRLLNGVIDKIKELFSFGGGAAGIAGNASPGFPPWPSSPAAQRGDSGVWRSVVALIRSTGPISGAFGNAYRPGDPLWHGSGRAVDWMGYNQDALATFLAARRPLELIHRSARRDYAYTRGQNFGSFDEPLMNQHANHVHIAMRMGGLIKELAGLARGGVVRLAKIASADFGSLTLAPGANLVHNGTGRPEHLATREAAGLAADLAALREVVALLREIRDGIRQVGPQVGGAIAGAGRIGVQTGRAYGRGFVG
jgi:hypothetical protein